MKRLALLLCGLTALYLAAQPISGTFGDLATVDVRPPAATGGGSGWTDSYYATNIAGYPAKFWYDGPGGITNAAGVVTNWPDYVSGWTLFPPSAVTAPAGTNTYNGLPTVKFDGVNDSLGSYAAALNGNESFELVFVWRYWNQHHNGHHMILGSTNSASPYFRNFILDNVRLIFGDSANNSTSFPLVTNAWLTTFYWRTPSGVDYYTFTNGVLAVHDALAGNIANLVGLRVAAHPEAGGFFAPIEIASLTGYQTNLGAAFWSSPRSNLFEYLTNKWH